MHSLKYFMALFLLAFSLSAGLSQDAYHIDVHMKNTTSDTLYLAYFYGDAQYIRDTAIRQKEDLFSFEGEELLPQGVYMFVLPPKNSFFQVMIDDDQRFTMTTDAQNVSGSTVIEGSEDNSVFYDYLNLIDQARKEKTTLQEEIKNTTDKTAEKNLDDQVVALDKKVLHKQDEILEKYPKSLSAMVIGASRDPHIPDFSGLQGEEKQEKALDYYRKHYFDQVDLQREAILRTPFIHQKVMDYFDKYTSQDPDSLNKAIDAFFSRLDENSTIYRYFLVKLLNKYANPAIVGQDAVYVHLAQQYYGRGKAPWVDEETLLKILDNAERFKYTLIGSDAPPLEIYDVYGEKELALKDIPGSYKVLIFWSSTCSHCKKVMPTIPAIEKEINDTTVRFVSVCTKADESCTEYLNEHDLQKTGIHALPISAYGRLYDVRTTPKVFIIDKDNKIASKGIGFDQIAQVIEMLKMEGRKSVKSTSVN